MIRVMTSSLFRSILISSRMLTTRFCYYLTISTTHHPPAIQWWSLPEIFGNTDICDHGSLPKNEISLASNFFLRDQIEHSKNIYYYLGGGIGNLQGYTSFGFCLLSSGYWLFGYWIYGFWLLDFLLLTFVINL